MYFSKGKFNYCVCDMYHTNELCLLNFIINFIIICLFFFFYCQDIHFKSLQKKFLVCLRVFNAESLPSMYLTKANTQRTFFRLLISWKDFIFKKNVNPGIKIIYHKKL